MRRTSLLFPYVQKKPKKQLPTLTLRFFGKIMLSIICGGKYKNETDAAYLLP
jgi:hypothetical protein